MKQNYGVLRVVRVRLPANATTHLQDRYPSGWLPEERLVHLLTQDVTSIGRALNNDIILMDPTVSREHARLVLDAQGWHAPIPHDLRRGPAEERQVDEPRRHRDL